VGIAEPDAVRILIVEDAEWDFVALHRAVMQEAPHAETLIASTLEEARVILSRRDLDLVVLDLNLPDGPAEGLLSEGLFAPYTTVVVLTVVKDPERLGTLMRLGVKIVRNKPSSPDEMVAVAHELVRDAVRAHILRASRLP
jgi:DNA-binding NarL/FixJ family response regulator